MRKSGLFIFNNFTNGKKFIKKIYKKNNLDLKKPTLFVSKFRFDNFSILLKRDQHVQLVYKHAISTIMPVASIQLQEFEDHELDPEGE